MHEKISWAMGLKVTKWNVDSNERESISGQTINKVGE